MRKLVTHRVVRKAVTPPRAYSQLLTQYGPLLRLLHDRLGSWEAVGLDLERRIVALQS